MPHGPARGSSQRNRPGILGPGAYGALLGARSLHVTAQGDLGSGAGT
ncbi:hypothetical protein [Streptomyces sp. NPDC006691]